MEFLTKDQLQKLNTKRLINLLKSVRVKERIGHRVMSCDCCGEYLGKDQKRDYAEHVAPFENYAEKIKKILSTRENVEKRVR